jgi:hypothetical protein
VSLGRRKLRTLKPLAFDEQSTFDKFPIKCSIKGGSLYTALLYSKAEVSKVDYSSKAVGSNVRGVGTFFDTRANLGQLSLYNYKNSYIHVPESSIKKIMSFWYLKELLKICFKICVKFCFSGLVRT